MDELASTVAIAATDPASGGGSGSSSGSGSGLVVRGEDIRIKHFTSRLYRPDGLDLTVATGEVLLIAGPSGCGKSSLALALNGLIPQQVDADVEGTVTVLGRDASTTRIGELARYVGMVFQDPDAQLVTPRVLDEVCFGLENLEVPATEIEPRARAALSEVGLAGLDQEPPTRLSGGQRQRLVLACAIAMRPELLVLDEPTSHIDPAGAVEFFALIPRLRARGMTIVIVDHDLDRVIEHADRMLVLDRTGAVLAGGAPADVFATASAQLAAAGIRLPVAVSAARALERAGATGIGRPVGLGEARRAFAAADTTGCTAPAAPATIPPAGQIVLQAERLQVRRGRRVVLADLSVSLRRGEFTAMLGRNGAGKTTAALALAGLIRSRGRLLIDGVDPRRVSMRQLSDRVGYVFQNPEHQFITSTVVDEVAHGLRRRGASQPVVTERVDELLERLDLTAVRDQHPFQLSGGQKRRLSVATVLATRPQLLLLDEPSYGLDEGATESLMELLARLAAEGTTIMMIVHDLALAATHANRVLVLQTGAIVADGPPEVLLTGDDLLIGSGLAPLPLRECLRDLAERDPRFRDVYRVDQLERTPR